MNTKTTHIDLGYPLTSMVDEIQIGGHLSYRGLISCVFWPKARGASLDRQYLDNGNSAELSVPVCLLYGLSHGVALLGIVALFLKFLSLF